MGEFISVKNVPREMGSESDPYLKCCLVDVKKKQKSREVSTLHFNDEKDVIWHSYRNLFAIPENGDYFRLCLWDKDVVTADDHYGSIYIPVEDLFFEQKTFDFPSNTKAGKAGCNVTLRRIHNNIKGPDISTKNIFFIRHGESKWNAAQEQKDVLKLLAYDHPLNKEGVEQAQRLQKKSMQSEKKESSEELFFQATQIYSSPLTRALQTALISLYEHPTLTTKGLQLLRSCREIKNICGFDTKGKKVGVEIKSRVEKQLVKILEEEGTKYTKDVQIDLNDANQNWWTHRKDLKGELDDRYYDFLCTMMYSEFEVGIVVTHSLFLRTFCNRYIGDAVKNQDIGDAMCTHKLQNAGCLRLKIHFEEGEKSKKDFIEDEKATILEAELMFGSEFGEVDTDKPEEVSKEISEVVVNLSP